MRFLKNIYKLSTDKLQTITLFFAILFHSKHKTVALKQQFCIFITSTTQSTGKNAHQKSQIKSHFPIKENGLNIHIL